jgi:DNA-binding NarL/FixJ family response regulator
LDIPADGRRAVLSVLIVDDHPLFRKGLSALLATVPELTVVGQADSGAAAEEMVDALLPDLVLMDLHMPGGSGLGAVQRITAAHPSVRILVVTMFQDDDSVFAALRAGARGYVLKDMDEVEMTRAIVAVGNGEAIFSAAIAERIMAFFATAPASRPPAFPELTESERNVLRLMARGHKNDAIASQLGLSPKTVRNYISSIFGKLQVADRAQAIVRAKDAQLE